LKKFIVVLVAAATLTVVGFTAYRFLSPKVVVINRSSFPIQEVTLNLPTSRVTFAAVEAGDTSTIYFSPQKLRGELYYSVQVNDISHDGTLLYADSTEYGRVIRIEVDTQGTVIVK
jgi:hypothetical protein